MRLNELLGLPATATGTDYAKRLTKLLDDEKQCAASAQRIADLEAELAEAKEKLAEITACREIVAALRRQAGGPTSLDAAIAQYRSEHPGASVTDAYQAVAVAHPDLFEGAH